MQVSEQVLVPQRATRPQQLPPGTSAVTLRDALLAMAPRPDFGVTLALAGVVARSWTEMGSQYLPLYGLDAPTTRDVLESHFPGCSVALKLTWESLIEPHAFAEAIELDDLVTLLADYRIVQDDDSLWLAHAIATACLGNDHLWQDMNLPSRGVLSDLLHGFFTSLAVRNRQDMKWKKFLYLQLCERAEIRVCKSPSCGVCADYKVCFGSEV